MTATTTNAPAPAEALLDLWRILLSRLSDGKEEALNAAMPAGKRGGRAHSAERTSVLMMPRQLSTKDAYIIVRAGIPSRSIAPLSVYLGLGKGAVAGYLDLDRGTATRKEAKDEVLPRHAAESMLRLLELDAMARDTFETPEEAAGWMQRPHPMLDGETPLDRAKSGFGAQQVKDILVAIKYGGVV